MAITGLGVGVRGVIQFSPFKNESSTDKFDAKLREGFWLGLDSRTDGNIVGTSYGIYRTSTIKGVPEDKRWSSAKVLAVIGMPWDTTPNVDAEDAARVPNPDAVEAEAVPKDPEVPESIARRMYIRKTDIVKFGETDCCIGRRTTMLGKPLQSHTPACRERIEAHLRKIAEARVKLQTELRRQWFGNQSG